MPQPITAPRRHLVHLQLARAILSFPKSWEAGRVPQKLYAFQDGVRDMENHGKSQESLDENHVELCGTMWNYVELPLVKTQLAIEHGQ